MRPENPYRPMEYRPTGMEAGVHSAADEQRRMEQARLKAEFYEQQLAQWEARQQQLAEYLQQKDAVNAELNELGMKIRNTVLDLKLERESFDREEKELAKIADCLQRHLTILSALDPLSWTAENFNDKLREELPKLERAENDFHQAYVIGRRFRHSTVFKNKPGEDGSRRLTWKLMGQELARGLAFHLPLFLLLLASWLLYHYALS